MSEDWYFDNEFALAENWWLRSTARFAQVIRQSIVVALAFQQDVLEDVAERQQSLEPVRLVDDDEAVDAGFADGVEDGVEAVVEGACVDAWEILDGELVWRMVWNGFLVVCREAAIIGW